MSLEEDATAQIEAHKRIARDNGLDDGEGLTQRVIVAPNDADDDAHFSWSPCELCLSTLGGDRYPITITLAV